MHNFHIVFVLDRSGSMSTIAPATISGFNEFLAAQKKAEGEAVVTLVQFDDQIEKVYTAVPIKKVNKLTNKTFVPRAMTALRDALHEAIHFGEAYESEGHVKPSTLVVVLTDGLDNVSKLTAHQINQLVTQKRQAGWEFVYIGANQDSWSVGTSLGFNGHNTHSFAANPQETYNTFTQVAGATAIYRSATTAGTYAGTFFEPEAKEGE